MIIRRGLVLATTLLLLQGCGFVLRQASTVPMGYQVLQLELPASDEGEQLRQQLINQLLPLGVHFDTQQGPRLRIVSLQPTRHLLNGKLTEVQLGLTVRFGLEDSLTGLPLTEVRQVVANRSYQYELATVNTENQQEGLLKQELYREVASLIARQLSTGRIPTRQHAASP